MPRSKSSTVAGNIPAGHKKQIPLEVCPSSNVCLGVAPSLALLIYAGLRVWVVQLAVTVFLQGCASPAARGGARRNGSASGTSRAGKA